MSAAAITIAPLERPQFDDSDLGNEGVWIFHNAEALARYWRTLGRAIGLEDQDGVEDLPLWLKEQHTHQMRNAARRQLRHGDNL